MRIINTIVGWIWRKKAFFAVMLASAVLFFVWFFPFSDLGQFVTTTVARATGNQVYAQFKELDVHLIPTPAVSATEVSIETGLPPFEAKWAKFTPSLLSALLNIRTLMNAGSDPAASRAMLTKLGMDLDLEGVFGGEIDLSISPGKKSDSGTERSRVSLVVDELNLGEVQDWADLPVKMQGKANFETDMQISPEFAEQPEGDYSLTISKFNLPASTVDTPMGPLNLPTLTLANVVLKGRMIGGNLMIEEGQFGSSSDPIYGRIKGQLGLRFAPGAPPMLGSYNLTVDLNASRAIEKDIGIAFILFDSAKTATSTGSRYLFRAMGNGPGGVPNITRLSSF